MAGERGRELGVAERATVKSGRTGPERALTVCEGVLARHGFEPHRESPTCVRLRNCPFRPLAVTATDLVCGMNRAFLTGMLTGLDATGVQAVMTPRPGECCAELRSAG